jgi:ESS family glutamate:Na+ symporter
MNFEWSFFVDVGIVSVALLVSTVIRAKVKFFQKFLIPNALTAGFILLLFYNFAGPPLGIPQEGLGQTVYHLLSISFIAMLLRKTESKRGRGGRGVIWFAAAVTFQIGAQALIGMLLTLFFMNTFIPDLFPSFGFLLPLGFALGPGQAFSIGSSWEASGFVGAGSVGLTFAALGFLFACFAGVYLINHGIRKGWLKAKTDEVANTDGGPGIRPRGSELPVGAKLTTDSDAIDSMTVNLGLVTGGYLLTYLFLRLISWPLIRFAGDMGMELVVSLWGISFVFASVVAILIRRLLNATKADHVLDNGSLTRIAGTSVDMTVAAAVGAISIAVVGTYWVPILVIAGIGGIFVTIMVPWMGSRLFANHRMHRTMIMYGAMTGTLPTGLALLRVIDPNFETPASSDYAYSSAITFLIVIPLVLIISFPVRAVTTGNQVWIWITLAIVAAYVVIGFVLYMILAGNRRFRDAGKIWMPRGDN